MNDSEETRDSDRENDETCSPVGDAQETAGVQLPPLWDADTTELWGSPDEAA